MFNQYTCNVTTGSTGQRTMFMGLDLSNLKPECALGERAPIDKELTLDKKVYTVADLMTEVSRPQKPKKPKLNATEQQVANYKKKMAEYPEKYRLFSNATKFNLMFNMMLEEGVVTRNTKVKVGHDGRLKEVYVVKTKESYRMFGNTYYGKI
jgi:hypothetical protein